MALFIEMSPEKERSFKQAYRYSAWSCPITGKIMIPCDVQVDEDFIGEVCQNTCTRNNGNRCHKMRKFMII